MELIIDGKRAALKAGSSFEYVSENRAFSDSDGYSLSITLPLRDCSQNIEIFGRIARMDANSHRATLNAELRFSNLVKRGVVTVVSSTEAEVKIQFLEGKSASNYAPDLDAVYINEMSLLTAPAVPGPAFPGTLDDGSESVALMWSNGASDWYDNNTSQGSGTFRSWTTDQISYMPYLIVLAKKVCSKLGLTADFTEWEQSPERFLLVCNTLPAVWGVKEVARALPHWTVNEFFTELERLLFCEFYIDLNAKTVSMKFIRNIRLAQKEISLPDVVDSYTAEVSDGSSCGLRSAKTIRYAERGSADEDPDWAINECTWLIRSSGLKIVEMTRSEFNEFLDQIKYNRVPPYEGALINYGPLTDAERGGDGVSWPDPSAIFGDIYYLTDENLFYIFKITKVAVANLTDYMADPYDRTHVWIPEPVRINDFGGHVSSNPDAGEIELKCVPARIESFDGQPRILLTPSAFGESDQSKIEVEQPVAYRLLSVGAPADKTEYYDKIFLAYWGPAEHDACAQLSSAPFPATDNRFSLYFRHLSAYGSTAINQRELLKASFLATRIPDVRSIFHIRGKRYLCEKITATFTENGMSQLLKGEFYQIVSA